MNRDHSHRLARLRRRARHLDEAPGPGVPEDPALPVARALAPLQRVVGPAGVLLLVGAVPATVWLADLRAGAFAAVPGALLVVLAWLGRAPARRRVTAVLATTVAGFLGIASAPGLAGLAGGSAGALYQTGCLLVAAGVLGVAWPTWREANAAGERAHVRRALYDEQGSGSAR